MVDSAFEQDSIKSCEASMCVFLWDCSASLLWFGEMDFFFLQNSLVCVSVKMATDITNSSSWNFKGLGGDLPKGVL